MGSPRGHRVVFQGFFKPGVVRGGGEGGWGGGGEGLH